jgi:serine/threonine-protein kinase RsbW
MMGCAKGSAFEIETAIREALANAVVHGCKNDASKTVQISVGCDEARGMVIVVRDPGSGFDPRSLPSPIQGQRLYAESGRGIYLINRLMDEVRFRKGGTEIWMRKS